MMPQTKRRARSRHIDLVLLLVGACLLLPVQSFLLVTGAEKPSVHPPRSTSVHIASGPSQRRLACPLFSTGTGDADAFARVVNARSSNKKYKPDAIPDSVLARMLTLTQRAPSSFNIQPWTCVVVRGEEAKRRLAGAMLGANSKAVLEAPVTAVFAADLESGRLLTKVQDIHRRAGLYPEAFLEKMPFFAQLFSGGHRTWLLRWVVHVLKRVLLFFVGLFKPAPRIDHPEAWAFKNAALAVQTFMLAATAHGLTTCPMEGFDAARVRGAVGLPRRYSIPMLVTVGYAAEGEREGNEAQPKLSERFSPQEVFSFDTYGGSAAQPLPWGLSTAAASA